MEKPGPTKISIDYGHTHLQQTVETLVKSYASEHRMRSASASDISIEELGENMRETFSSIDENSSGIITMHEFQMALQKMSVKQENIDHNHCFERIENATLCHCCGRSNSHPLALGRQ